MIRRQPRSTRTYTLLPYTTLFRSRERALLGVVFGQDRFDAALLASFGRNLGEFSAYMNGFRRAASEHFIRLLDEKLQQPSAVEVARLQRDRKSTRLNSSH